jgi:SPP1 family predicted phage head-tail adaptor
MINAGKLKSVLYLQESTNSRGNPGTWANVATNPEFRCAMKTVTGSEPSRSSGQGGELKIQITMRYREDVTHAKRFSDGAGRVFDIDHIDNTENSNRKLVVNVIERKQING